MYVDSCKSGKYTRHLLRESFRHNGKVKHRTLANLSHCSEDEIQAIKLALKHKHNLSALSDASEQEFELQQGLSAGAVLLLMGIVKELGIEKALGYAKEGKLALWQVMARIIDQGSRLSAVRLAGTHAACDVIGIKKSFDEDDLYENLDWLCENQSKIEARLFKTLHGTKQPSLYLYDVTSSYLEGQNNELSAWGYNRDGKKGKKQIVIGLLCDEEGRPLSIEVFKGNTQDTKTVASQIHKVAERFGGKEVTFVGDRGMLKSKQIEDLSRNGFHYITAITKAQVESLLTQRVIQMELFEEKVAEVEQEDLRYIFRRNPVRAEEMKQSRQSKLDKVKSVLNNKNDYLHSHPRASVEVALRHVEALAIKLKIHPWIQLTHQQGSLNLQIDEEALSEASKLDGCYVLKTDLKEDQASKECIHDRYKDLAQVERAFRSCKTVELEMRPIHVRRESRTRGHAFVVMLAYRVVQELAKRWNKLDLTVEEGIEQLSSLCATDLKINGKSKCSLIPRPRTTIQKLLKLAQVKLPDSISCSHIPVHTRTKLHSRRKPI